MFLLIKTYFFYSVPVLVIDRNDNKLQNIGRGRGGSDPTMDTAPALFDGHSSAHNTVGEQEVHESTC